MFTGIVTHRGRVERVEPRADGSLRLVLTPERPFEGLVLGASVAVDGVCLTVAHMDDGRLAFDVVPETLRRTTLSSLRTGARVNLERSLRVGDELGGHWVQGHVDGVGEVFEVEHRGADVRFSVGLPEGLAGAVVPKGSVTLDGVSLTVGEVWQEGTREAFCVYLIPHTLAVTGLSERAVGTRVNVEVDPLGRWVRSALETHVPPRG
jgi:riboflavin synthase